MVTWWGEIAQVDQTAFYQVEQGRTIYQRHNLSGAHALGQHRRQDIGLVVVGQRAEDVHRLDVFFEQQVRVGGVTEQDDCGMRASPTLCP